jgi:hypothetical protein
VRETIWSDSAAPLVIDNTVIAGGIFGMRRFLDAYDTQKALAKLCHIRETQ